MTDLGIYFGVPVSEESVVPLVEEHSHFTELLGALHCLSFVHPYKNPHFAEFSGSPMCSYNALDFGTSLVPSAVTFMFMCCVTLPAHIVSCRLPGILLRSILSVLFNDPVNC
jgi:hypothetical protein